MGGSPRSPSCSSCSSTRLVIVSALKLRGQDETTRPTAPTPRSCCRAGRQRRAARLRRLRRPDLAALVRGPGRRRRRAVPDRVPLRPPGPPEGAERGDPSLTGSEVRLPGLPGASRRAQWWLAPWVGPRLGACLRDGGRPRPTTPSARSSLQGGQSQPRRRQGPSDPPAPRIGRGRRRVPGGGTAGARCVTCHVGAPPHRGRRAAPRPHAVPEGRRAREGRGWVWHPRSEERAERLVGRWAAPRAAGAASTAAPDRDLNAPEPGAKRR